MPPEGPARRSPLLLRCRPESEDRQCCRRMRWVATQRKACGLSRHMWLRIVEPARPFRLLPASPRCRDQVAPGPEIQNRLACAASPDLESTASASTREPTDPELAG